MAGNTAATTEATTAIYRWTRNSIIVKVVKQNEKGEDIKTISCSSCCDEQKKTSGDDDSMMIVNEGYAGIAEIKNVEILHLTNPPGDCPDGKLCVKTKDPLFGCSIETGPCTDADQFIMYELEIPNLPRDKIQPRIVLLESQMKGYFLHWSWPGLKVMCQPMQKYDDKKEPLIDITNTTDQRFVWVIPTDTNGSNEFSLKPYDESYYLACKGASGTAVLREGDAKDLEKYNNFKLKCLKKL